MNRDKLRYASYAMWACVAGNVLGPEWAPSITFPIMLLASLVGFWELRKGRKELDAIIDAGVKEMATAFDEYEKECVPQMGYARKVHEERNLKHLHSELMNSGIKQFRVLAPQIKSIHDKIKKETDEVGLFK